MSAKIIAPVLGLPYHRAIMPPSQSADQPRRSGSSRLWLLAAIALFLLQTLPFFSYRWLTDESWYAGPGMTISQGTGVHDPGIGPNDTEHTFDARPPGTALVMAGFFKLFGINQIAARLGSLLAGVAIVVLVFHLSRDLFGDQAALVAAFVAATDNLLVLTSRAARPEALTTMSILLGLLALKKYRSEPRLPWAFSTGLLMALGTMFHITLAGYLVSLGLLFIVLDHQAKRFPLRGALVYTAGFLAGLVPFAVWILTNPIGPRSFHEEYLGRTGDPLGLKIVHEFHRYSDLFGFNMLHGHGLDALPLRLPIPLIFVLASYFLWRYRRKLFHVEQLLLIPTVLWLAYTVNKSSRYLALLAPLFAMVIGGAVGVLRSQPRLQRLMLGLAGFVIVAQLGANAYLLRGASKANYNLLGRELRQAIPGGSTSYGTITFWLALRDRPYISYERTTPQQAAHDFGARYFILGDRIMTQGSDWESDYYKTLNRQLAELTGKGTMIDEIHDPYYGDLKIYRIPDSAAQ